MGDPPQYLSSDIEFTLKEGMDTPEQPSANMKTPVGHAGSFKSAAVYSPYVYNLEIPTNMLLEKSDFVLDLVQICQGGHQWGRNTAISSDGMDSMNKLFRESFLGCQAGL